MGETCKVGAGRKVGLLHHLKMGVLRRNENASAQKVGAEVGISHLGSSLF